MATVTRRYAFVGPATLELTTYVAASAAVANVYQGPIVDINIDNAAPGAIEQLDLYMTQLGYQFNASAQAPLTLITIAGDGSDGDVNVGAGTTTLTRDMYYNNLTVPTGGDLRPNGFRIFCKDLCQVDAGGAISQTAGDGTAAGVAGTGRPTAGNTVAASGPSGGAGGVAGGAAGSNSADCVQGFAGIGGAGGAGAAGAGGAAGTIPARAAATQGNPRSVLQAIFGDAIGGTAASRIGAGSGGGGGGGDATAGGGGGGGGGYIHIVARRVINNGSIEAKGGAGGTPGAGNRGGGGGGGGGLIVIVYRSYTGNAPSVAGGAAGAGTGTGAAGTAGTAGLYIPHPLL